MLYEKLRLRIRNAIRYIGESDLFQFYGENENNGNFSLSWKKDWSISIIEGEGFLSATESVVFCFQNSINRYGNIFQRGNLVL